MKLICRLIAICSLTISLHAATPLDDSLKVGGFVIGCQAYSFNRYTAFEAIEKTREADGKTIEFFLWQKLSTNHPGVELNGLLSDKHIDELKAKLKKENIRAVSAYFGNTAFQQKDPEAALRKVFDFAKKLDLVSLTGEPPISGFDLVEKLCKEYDIRFCLHNHRKDENKPEYQVWNPDYTVKLMKGRDKRMGFCLDTGHLVRSGLKPVDALKKMKGRVHSLHLKDPVSSNDHDTIYGEGVADVRGILQELRKQKFDGFISIEYEHNWTNSVPEIRQCIDFVRKDAANKR